MRDAQYLRAQAELCLELARPVENLQAEAARYHAEAAANRSCGTAGIDEPFAHRCGTALARQNKAGG
jgi:hypothetical protein